MKVSVITVVFNDACGVLKTLTSIDCFFNELTAFIDVELIVVNGKSTDSTDDVVSKCLDDSEHEYVYINEADRGIYDAMNKAVEHCSLDSDYCIFMNAGDMFSDNASEVFLNVMHEVFTMSDIIIFPIKSVDINGKFVNIRKFEHETDLYIRPVVPHQSTFIRTELIREVKYDLNYKILADYDFFCKCLASGKIFYKVNGSELSLFKQGGASNLHDKQFLYARELARIQSNIFGSISLKYIYVPILRGLFYRYSFVSKFDLLIRKLFIK